MINNTAYIKSVTGKTGLLNIKTNQIIGKMDYYYTIYDTHAAFYYQEKTEEACEENNWTSRKTVRIYDALNEKTLVDGWEVVKNFGDYYELVVVKSPVDGKLHLFDRYACRKPTNIFDMSLDDVEELYSEYNDTYLVVTAHDKKGLYHHNCYNIVPSLVTPIEFDNIEKFPNIIVYTKNKQKYFVYTGKDRKTSNDFDTITIDKKNKNIVYCKKDDKIYVYNTEAQELLLSTDSDEIKYIYKNGDSYNDCYGEFFFEIMKDGQFGMMSSEISYETRKAGVGAKVSTLLPPNYDEIITDYDVSYLKKDGKIGLFIGNSYHNQVIEPKYDDIDSLGYNYFALYTDGLCDIGKATSYAPFTPSITHCEITKTMYRGFIFKKNDKYGLLLPNCNHKDVITQPQYDSVSSVAKHYFLLEKNNKKGLMHLGKIMLPIEYDEISVGGLYGKYEELSDAKVLYFALRKGTKYELAKIDNYQYGEADVEFLSNHLFDAIDFFREIMVFKDEIYSYIYDYNEKLLKTLPTDTLITPIAKPCDEYDEQHNYRDYFYCIDGVYYYYKDGKFEEVFTEENDFYVTTYETDTDSFEIKTLSKQEHDAFCDYIDTQAVDLAEQSLAQMSTDAQTLKEKYPTLVLKKIERSKNLKKIHN